jgi:hypothetical protein
MGLQSHGNPNFENFGIPNLRIPWQDDIWVQALWLSINNIIRGKVVASFKCGPWWVLWVCVYPWLVHAQKMLQLCINQLVVWFVQVCENNWPIFIHFNPHPGALTHPSTPKCYEPKSVYPNFLSFRCFHLGITIESFKEFGGHVMM